MPTTAAETGAYADNDAAEQQQQQQQQPSQEAAEKVPDPSGLTFAFGDMNGIILKGMRGHVVTAEDLVPLPQWMQTADVLRRFDEMMGMDAASVAGAVTNDTTNTKKRKAKKGAVWRVPLRGCWLDDDVAEMLGTAQPPLGSHSQSQTAVVQGPLGLRGSVGDDGFLVLLEKEERGAGTPTAPTAAAAALAIASVRDRARLYVSQDSSLAYLLVRLSAYHIFLSTIIALAKTAATVLQVWSLWTVVVMIGGAEAPYNGYSTGVQYVIALCLPLSAVLVAELNHNQFHVAARSAIVCRSAVIGLAFEKMRLVTPLHLGAAGEAATGGASKESGKEKEGTNASSPPPPPSGGRADAVGAKDVPMVEMADGKEASPVVASPTSPTGATNASSAGAPSSSSSSSSQQQQGVSSGQLLNIVSSDANSLIEAFIMGPFVISCLLDIFLGVAWIAWVIGWAAGPLCGAILVLLGVQFWFGDRVRANKGTVAAVTDRRLRALTEFLEGIHVVKCYAWEANVREMIGALRRAEAALHVAGNVWKLLGLASIFFVGAVYSLVVFAVKLTYDSSMGAGDVFVTMTLIGIVSRGFAMIPRALTGIGSSLACIRRIEGFLALDVTSGLPRPSAADGSAAATTAAAAATTVDGSSEGVAVCAAPSDVNNQLPVAAFPPPPLSIPQSSASVNNVGSRPFRIVGDFGWKGFALRGVNLACPEGSLTVIIGSVGSGKSTLLQAVLGACSVLSPDPSSPMSPSSPTFPKPLLTSPSSSAAPSSPFSNAHAAAPSLIQLPGRGSVAYVAQEAFIYDATVRENITFGKPFEEKRYREVVKACSLVTDLQQWGGDLVEVAFNTLSGGQRQRISLARACYADADLYIVDDPISAVDAAVGRHLLEKCFRGYLKGKTILLATHHPAPAKLADQVVLMDHGAMRIRPVSEAARALAEQLMPMSPLIVHSDEALRSGVAFSPPPADAAAAGNSSDQRKGATTAEDKKKKRSGPSPLSEGDFQKAMARLEAEEGAEEQRTNAALLVPEGANEEGAFSDAEEGGDLPGAIPDTAAGVLSPLAAEANAAVNPHPSQRRSSASGAVDVNKDTNEDPSQSNAAAAATVPAADEDAVLNELIGKSRELRQKEVEAAGAVSLAVYRTYVRGGGWGLCLVTCLLFLLAQALRSVQDWWFAAWTRRDFTDLSNDQYLYILGILVGALILASFARTVIFGVFTIRASSALHDRMFEAIIASPLHFFEQVPLGRIMNRFSKDLDYCDDLVPRTLFDFLQNILTIVGSLALLIYSVPWFAIAVPFAFVIFYLLIRAYMPSSRYIKRIEGTSRSPALSAFQTAMGGLTTLRAYGRLGFFQSLFFTANDLTTNALLHSTCTQRWMGLRMDWVASVWVGVASVLCIALQDELGPSLVGLCLSQSLSFTGLLQFAVRMAAETENLMTSVERLEEYAQLPGEANEGTIVVGPSAAVGTSSASVPIDSPASAARLASWPEGCDIAVKGLTMAYASNPTHNVLRDLHFIIKAGQRVAVVGRTGAGKSSLLAAFYRTAPIPSGAISIGGLATTDMDVFAMRARLGIIPQVPTLFNGTFRYNLDPFGRYSDLAMEEALRKVTLFEYVAARQGLDTSVGDGGANLSVGQRQLLCAARVLLTGATILFMDEATANIDEETDDKIQQIMREEAARRQMTIITIAHRLNTVMDYDLVLVMSQGRLVEYGNPRELVAAGTEGDKAEGPFVPRVVVSDCGGYVTDVRAENEVRQFAKMVRAMHDAHGEGAEHH